ncbi:MAG TPA: hypothetical protein VN238_22860 [Solirubrobacteraceae bacterium]|nr:hypothetical protein [Solirubrobacteraceae bacterium]
MSSITAFVRRIVAASVLAATLAVAGTAGSAAVAPAEASAAVWLRVTCHDVWFRTSPGGPPYSSAHGIPQGWEIEMLEWPTSIWIKVRFAGLAGWVDGNCVTLV